MKYSFRSTRTLYVLKYDFNRPSFPCTCMLSSKNHFFILAFRNFSLLSFGEEAEEDESVVASVNKVRYKSIVLLEIP